VKIEKTGIKDTTMFGVLVPGDVFLWDADNGSSLVCMKTRGPDAVDLEDGGVLVFDYDDPVTPQPDAKLVL